MKTKAFPSDKVSVGCLKIGSRERHYINKVLDSSRLSYGPMCQEFERRVAEAHDVRHGIFCNSGTSALEAAVAVLKETDAWPDGSEIIVPSITFVATANVVLHNKLTPVFVDVDPKTYTLDPTKLEEAITPRTKAIIPVHVGGLPCDMWPIMNVAARNNLRVIEDSCETMFASYNGQSVGSFGDIACFSMYVAHLIVTGVGGMSVTNDDQLAIKLRSYINHGRDSVYISIDDDDESVERLTEIIPNRFKFLRLGQSSRATELEAAIGLGQLDNVHRILNRRVDYALRLTDALSHIAELQLPTIPTDRTHSFMFYPIVVKDGNKRELVNFLEFNGIETRDLLPLLNQPIYTRLYGDLLPKYPVAQWLDQGAFYIGCHQELTHSELDHTVKKFYEFFK